jgi:hypothetical protein
MPTLGLLALLHLAIGWRLVPYLALPWGIALALVLAASLAAIPLAFYGRRSADRRRADRFTWAGMLALGAFSMLLVATLAREAVLLLALAFDAPPAWWTATAQAVPLLALAATLLGLLNARRTARVRDVTVPIAGLPAALHGFTIAQISDLHIGPTVKAPYVRAVVERVNRIGADAVAITGDLVDGRVRDLADDAAPLADLRSRHGTFFVTGNHEYYSGAPEWIALVRRLGATPRC